MDKELSAGEVVALQQMFERAAPQTILQWAVECFGDGFVVVTSFQPTGIVTLHMLESIMEVIPVITLDTDLLFEQTYELIDALQTRFRLNLIRARSKLTLQEQQAQHGAHLWESNPDLCCHLRKTLPLKESLQGYKVWTVGLRRDQSSRRAELPTLEWDEKYQLWKIAPFATWTEDMVWTYIRAYHLPYNILHDQGYPSIGCFPCTDAIMDGRDPRSGRWKHSTKTECGIHVNIPISTTPTTQE